MAREIEHKYLVLDDTWKQLAHKKTKITQTYLIGRRNFILRVRLHDDGPAILCIKRAKQADGIPEYEWQVPVWLAKICNRWQRRTMKKTRYNIPWGELTIEVDVFHGELDGLIVAEVELPDIDHRYETPHWFGADVTNDSRYKNSRLLRDGVPT